MSQRRTAFALGSNLGDRLEHLRAGAAFLIDGLDVTAVSPVYETAPVGGPPQGDFLNAVVIATTDLAPEELLEIAHLAEDARGRTRGEQWGPRTLDVDILTVGELVLATDDLVLPHPRAVDRAFVLLPWRDADPDAVLPDEALPGGRRVADLADSVDAAGVRCLGDLLADLLPISPDAEQ